MAEAGQKLIEVLQDRLYATLTNGPLMSCRPHSSRQRIDLMQLGKLNGPTPKAVLAGLLGKERSAKLIANDGAGATSGNGNGGGNDGGNQNSSGGGNDGGNSSGGGNGNGNGGNGNGNG